MGHLPVLIFLLPPTAIVFVCGLGAYVKVRDASRWRDCFVPGVLGLLAFTWVGVFCGHCVCVYLVLRSTSFFPELY